MLSSSSLISNTHRLVAKWVRTGAKTELQHALLVPLFKVSFSYLLILASAVKDGLIHRDILSLALESTVNQLSSLLDAADKKYFVKLLAIDIAYIHSFPN